MQRRVQFQRAIEDAYFKDVLVFAAAHNEHPLTRSYPAMFAPPLISVDKGLFDDPLQFAYIMLITVAFTTAVWIAVTFLTPPEPMKTLVAFYRRVRPWGFWGPILAKVLAEDPAFERNKDFKRDMERWSVPAINMVYADTSGDIAWIVAGHSDDVGGREPLFELGFPLC